MNPKNPTSREKEEHEDSGHAVSRSWCEEEEHLEAEIPRVGMNPKIQRAERIKCMKIQDTLFTGVGVCRLCRRSRCWWTTSN